MDELTDFDLQAAHSYFAAWCFNRAWDLMEKPDRTPQEDEDMIRLSHASHWHWTQRQEYTAKNASIAYWQLARIYALLGQAANARRYGGLCLEASQGGAVEPFYLGYACEALARAEAVAGDHEKAEAYRQLAREAAGQVESAEQRELLLNDLETIG